MYTKINCCDYELSQLSINLLITMHVLRELSIVYLISNDFVKGGKQIINQSTALHITWSVRFLNLTVFIDQSTALHITWAVWFPNLTVFMVSSIILPIDEASLYIYNSIIIITAYNYISMLARTHTHTHTHTQSNLKFQTWTH